MSRRGTNIRKRTDGRWEGRYYIVDTAGSKKCKSVYGHSYKEVTERLLTAKAASLNQTAAPKQSAITVKAVAEKWLESIASSRKCSTIQKYSTIYNKYIKPNWGESVIDELNQNEILKELPETAGESVTKSILCIFNSILAYGAATYGTGEIHLSYRAKRSSVTSSNNINTINTIDQQKLTEYLLTELDIYKLGILLCLFMGLRLGEICALKWEDIDMISRTLHVNRTVQRLNSKFARRYYNRILDLIKKYNIEKQIIFHGEVSSMDLLRQNMDIELMCAERETFGWVTVEGMRSGLLVIGANTGATPEIITNMKTGLLYTHGDARDLADKIEWVLKNPSSADEIRKNGKKFSDESFTIEENGTDVYRAIMSCQN